MKQVIVLRKDLNMRKGKMVAQGAHASMGAVLPYLRWSWREVFSLAWWHGRRKVKRWLRGPFKKVCVYVESEDQLLDMYVQAKGASLITCLITDSGLTEFGGVPTRTAVAVGPDTEETVDMITGKLKLL